jgi:hypothetical protein
MFVPMVDERNRDFSPVILFGSPGIVFSILLVQLEIVPAECLKGGQDAKEPPPRVLVTVREAGNPRL